MILTREQIQAADDRPREVVEVPQWGGSVYVASMSAGEKAAWENYCIESGDNWRKNGVRVRLAIRCCEDDAGTRLFTDDDFEWLSNKSAAAIERVAEVAARLNALSKTDEDELAKNSPSGPQST